MFISCLLFHPPFSDVCVCVEFFFLCFIIMCCQFCNVLMSFFSVIIILLKVVHILNESQSPSWYNFNAV